MSISTLKASFITLIFNTYSRSPFSLPISWLIVHLANYPIVKIFLEHHKDKRIPQIHRSNYILTTAPIWALHLICHTDMQILCLTNCVNTASRGLTTQQRVLLFHVILSVKDIMVMVFFWLIFSQISKRIQLIIHCTTAEGQGAAATDCK